MNPPPTGRLIGTADGHDLVLERTFRAPVEDVWASITEPERTALWFAWWSGDAGPGKTIRYRMDFEEGQPEGDLTIDEVPRLLAVSTSDEYGSWRLEARLHHQDGVTTLRFTHHLDDSADPGMVGPGWEYYLDRLVTSRADGPPPDFDDYFPAQQAHYAALVPE